MAPGGDAGIIRPDLINQSNARANVTVHDGLTIHSTSLSSFETDVCRPAAASCSSFLARRKRHEQAEAIAAIAQRLKFRAKSVVVLPEAKKIQYLLDLPVIPEAVAARLLISHHIANKRVMMAAFLDALGVAHDNGMIAEDAVIPQESDKIHAAVRAIAESFPAEDVALYLSTLSWQDPQTWSVLAKLPETRIPDKE